MKFACFERTVEALYKYVVPKPREKCSKIEQLGVSFVGGYTGMLYSLFIHVKFF
jgi:solute carrier family 25 phosphate transporter 3